MHDLHAERAEGTEGAIERIVGPWTAELDNRAIPLVRLEDANAIGVFLAPLRMGPRDPTAAGSHRVYGGSHAGP
jgi:hypothetical protein